MHSLIKSFFEQYRRFSDGNRVFGDMVKQVEDQWGNWILRLEGHLFGKGHYLTVGDGVRVEPTTLGPQEIQRLLEEFAEWYREVTQSQ